MQIIKQIFKKYDIRGLVDSEVTPELAFAVGKGFAALLSQEIHGQMSVAVGRDMRPSSLELQALVMDGLMHSGVHVIDIGLVSTPAFYFGVSHTNASGGIMVSASHNPAAYNGFKLTRARAVPVSGDTGILELARIIETEAYLPVVQGSRKMITNIPALDVREQMRFSGVLPIKPMKIVADSGNGMGAQYLDETFVHIDADVTRLFWEFDGTFPNHEADPFKLENTEALRRKVVELGADVGIATDGDGDRIFFVDDQGELLAPAILRGLLAQIMLRDHPGATVCYDIRPGKITRDMIEEAGGIPSITRVGHSLIKEQMQKDGAVFGGESSGHFFYAFPAGVFEGPVTVVMQMLQEITRQGKSLSQIVAPLRRYVHSGEMNFRVSDPVVVMQRIKNRFIDGEQNELDGISVSYPTFWFNVRGSNTEPLVRLNLEAVDRETMETKRDELRTLIETV